MRPRKRPRGFTIVEMLISMTIMGLVLALAVVEFAMVFNHNSLTSANITAEANARIAMAKVTNEMRQAMPDVTDFTTPPYPMVVTPTAPPASTAPGTAQTIQYYRVDNGSAGLTASPIPVDANGNPVPCYDLITLTYDPVGQTITRTIQLVTNTNCTAPSTTNDVLARNVVGFTVSAESGTLFDVDLQTRATKGAYNIYDLNTQVALGYKP